MGRWVKNRKKVSYSFRYETFIDSFFILVNAQTDTFSNVRLDIVRKITITFEGNKSIVKVVLDKIKLSPKKEKKKR